MTDEYDISTRAEQATEKLQKARRGFEELKRDEESYLKDREVKAQARVERLIRQAESATMTLEALNGHIVRRMGDHSKRFREFCGSLSSILDKAERVIRESNRISERAKDTLEKYERMSEALSKRVGEISEFEKALKVREREVKLKTAKAEEALAEATRIADWHGRGERYTLKK